eukprot:CAMPEP_0197891716 /NCGR_PEP_ID=MMETSP1439-20131203/29514_1 /TAXON_ID=66791 /ORGANISM="Gonyaulax spinifera, Strain CCMP409" /LENGTH=164 /DNA_ID=CAMNT_0043511843 /DNA_START=188 /DNA_END=683 /DNA_ORIENTATION=-
MLQGLVQADLQPGNVVALRLHGRSWRLLLAIALRVIVAFLACRAAVTLEDLVGQLLGRPLLRWSRWLPPGDVLLHSSLLKLLQPREEDLLLLRDGTLLSEAAEASEAKDLHAGTDCSWSQASLEANGGLRRRQGPRARGARRTPAASNRRAPAPVLMAPGEGVL